MNDAELDAEQRRRQAERWDRAITVSVLAVIASGIIEIAAHDVFFHQPIRSRSFTIACIYNLKAINGAKAAWALENQKDTNAIPTDNDLFGSTSYIREKPACPKGGTYTLGTIATKPRCSIPGHTI